MKVFNISDVETKKLKQRGLVSHTVAIGKQLLSPGESVEVSDDSSKALAAGIQELVDLGVLAVDAPPKGYASADKAKITVAKEESVPVAMEKPKFSSSKKNKDG